MSVGLAAALLFTTPARAGDIYVAQGESLQAAIDRAQPGDRLLLQPGATFVGNFRLPNKGPSTAFITIRSAAPDSLLPPDGVRISPADAINLPKIKSPNTMSALVVAAGAHHWRLQFLEFQANDRGYGDIISLGMGDSTQTQLSQVPYQLVLDRLLIRGDPAIGQKRGVALHSGATWVINSYISDMKGVGMDTQALMGYNGPGPWYVVNNYLEGAGENVLIGGASPKISGLIPSDLEFRRNHMPKPLSWRQPILSTPANVTAVGQSGGALPAATYSYRIVATRRTAQDSWAFSNRSSEVTAAVGAGGRVTVSWSPVPNAALYRVYRGSSPGAQDRYFETTSASFVDDGTLAGVAGTGSTIKGTVWTVKNTFELKVGQRVTVEGNLFEHCWAQAQVGFAIVFTPRNQDNTSPWVYVRDVNFTGNIVRGAGGGVVIEGYDNNGPVQQTQRINITNNIFDDIFASKWGGTGRFVQIGSQPRDIRIDHNTVVHDGHVIFVHGSNSSGPLPVYGLVLTNNLMRHNAYGIMGDNVTFGNTSLAAYFPDATVLRNTFAGGSASRYPPDNEFPTVAAWQAEFVNYAAADYHLNPTSPYVGTATDGGDLGAPISRVEADAQLARAGRDSGTTPSAPVTIVTTSLEAGQVGTPYTATLAASGGSGSYVWSVSAGQLPPGLTLGSSTGLLSGTPSQPGSFVLTVRAQDASDADNAGTQGYTVPIGSVAPTVTITSPVNAVDITGDTVALAASASDADGMVQQVDFHANGSFVGKAQASPWALTWSGVTPGTYRLTATATDDSGLTGTSAPVDITVAADAAAPCTFSVSPASFYSGAPESNYSLTVTASRSSCTWTTASPVAWISFNKTGGTGSGTVWMKVQTNTSGSRSGSATVADQSIGVFQEAATQPAPSSCSYAISPTSATATAAATTLTVTVTTQAGCAWSTAANASWIAVGPSGTGSGTTTVSVAAATHPPTRIGTATIAGQTFTVTQAGFKKNGK